jgi:hypothetical protein
MTNIEQQDARLIAMDAATVAAIRLHAPEFEAPYLADDLPRWFQHQLDHARPPQSTLQTVPTTTPLSKSCRHCWATR